MVTQWIERAEFTSQESTKKYRYKNQPDAFSPSAYSLKFNLMTIKPSGLNLIT